MNIFLVRYVSKAQESRPGAPRRMYEYFIIRYALKA